VSAEAFDWLHPNYDEIYRDRSERLARLRAHPDTIAPLRAYYAEHIAEFVGDWGLTSDPRARSRGSPIEMPFKLFPKQIEMLDFVQECMRNRSPGLIEKSRDCGASWLVCCFAASLCLFNRGVVVGLGSRTEAKLSRIGDPDSIFWKVLFFLKNLPPEFRGSWDETKHSAHLRIQFPDTGSSIVGEAGDGIGRGGRSTVYFIDESAFIERPQLIEASLASNCDTRIDVSTPNGRSNSFATKRWSGRVPVFTFRWLDDPRKNYPGSNWYERQCATLDSVTRAQEIDLSYDASVEGILIPVEWVNAAIDAHTKLGITPSGARRAALDPADEGRDRCALAGRHGILLDRLTSWSGKNSDIYRTTVKTFGLLDEWVCEALDFDADGLGAGVRGDAVDINAKRRDAGRQEITVEAFRGSGGVFDPDGSLVEGRLNRDYFANLKAQSYWALRLRFQATYRAVVEGLSYDPDSIISIDPELDELNALVTELVQPTYEISQVGKIFVNKTPEGAQSPNLADAVMIAYSPFHAGAYFAPPAVPSAPEGFKVHPLPTRMQQTFALMTFLDDAAAVIYCAVSPLASPPFFVIDWDVVELPTPEWVGGIEWRLDELFEVVTGYAMTGEAYGTKQTYVDDPRDISTEFLRQCGFRFASFDKDFRPDQVLPPVAERFAKARPYVNFGLAVVSRPALEREVPFRGVKRNFLRELLSQSEVAQSNPLAQVFASAVLGFFKNAPGVTLAPGDEIPAPPPRRRAAAPPPPCHILLPPGRHVIDGEVVVVPGESGQLVMFYLSAGKHIIDNKITYVAKPGAGIPWEP
jgi:phage terminase large subunit